MGNPRASLFGDLKNLPQYQGRTEAEIESNVNDVLNSNDAKRKSAFLGALNQTNAYGGTWKPEDIEKDVRYSLGFGNDVDAQGNTTDYNEFDKRFKASIDPHMQKTMDPRSITQKELEERRAGGIVPAQDIPTQQLPAFGVIEGRTPQGVPVFQMPEVVSQAPAPTEPFTANTDEGRAALWQKYQQIAEKQASLKSPEDYVWDRKAEELNKGLDMLENSVVGIASAGKSLYEGGKTAAEGIARMASNPYNPAEQLRGAGDIANGAMTGAMGAIPVVGQWQAISGMVAPAVQSLASQIGGEQGQKVAEKVTSYAAALPFGFKVVLAQAASEGGQWLVEQVLNNTETGKAIPEQDRKRIVEASGHVGFFLALGVAPKAESKAIELANKHLTEKTLESIGDHYSPKELKDVYIRANQGTATPEEMNLVKRINSTFAEKGDAIRKGFTDVTETTKIQPKAWVPKWIADAMELQNTTETTKKTVIGKAEGSKDIVTEKPAPVQAEVKQLSGETAPVEKQAAPVAEGTPDAMPFSLESIQQPSAVAQNPEPVSTQIEPVKPLAEGGEAMYDGETVKIVSMRGEVANVEFPDGTIGTVDVVDLKPVREGGIQADPVRAESAPETNVLQSDASKQSALRDSDHGISAQSTPEKNSWEMTKKEYADSGNEQPEAYHRNAVISAFSEGKQIPENVLAEYPELTKKPEKPAKLTQEELDAKELEKPTSWTHTDANGQAKRTSGTKQGFIDASLAEGFTTVEHEKRGNGDVVRLVNPITSKGRVFTNAAEIRYIDKVAPKAAEPSKEPWRMTPKEYTASAKGPDEKAIMLAAHPQHVKEALSAGKKVPDAVLDAYKNNVWAQKAKGSSDAKVTAPEPVDSGKNLPASKVTNLDPKKSSGGRGSIYDAADPARHPVLAAARGLKVKPEKFTTRDGKKVVRGEFADIPARFIDHKNGLSLDRFAEAVNERLSNTGGTEGDLTDYEILNRLGEQSIDHARTYEKPQTLSNAKIDEPINLDKMKKRVKGEYQKLAAPIASLNTTILTPEQAQKAIEDIEKDHGREKSKAAQVLLKDIDQAVKDGGIVVGDDKEYPKQFVSLDEIKSEHENRAIIKVDPNNEDFNVFDNSVNRYAKDEMRKGNNAPALDQSKEIKRQAAEDRNAKDSADLAKLKGRRDQLVREIAFKPTVLAQAELKDVKLKIAKLEEKGNAGMFAPKKEEGLFGEKKGAYISADLTKAEKIPTFTKTAVDLLKGTNHVIENASITDVAERAKVYSKNSSLSHQLVLELTSSDIRRSTAGVLSRYKALGIAKEIVEHGTSEIIGKTVRNPLDLAGITQIYRDPRFETFRYIFVKGDKVVGHTGSTVRLPGAATARLPGSNSAYESVGMVRDLMKSSGADGVWVIHNHPSGNPTPSHDDLLAMRTLRRLLPELKGHVVIDSNKYAHIRAYIERGTSHDIAVDYAVIDHDFGEDKLLTPSMPHEVIGMKVNGPGAISDVAKQFHAAEGYVTLVCADSRMGVRSIVEVPEHIILNEKLGGEEIKRIARESGTPVVFLAGISLEGEHNGLKVARVSRLLQDGYLLDAVTDKGESFNGPIVEADNMGMFGIFDIDKENSFVKEARANYTPGPKQTETPEFKKWFGSSKVVDEKGEPIVMFHGTKRPDRIADRFRSKRATSGPMAYFTADPDIASHYSTGKEDTSLDHPDDYAGWFKFKSKSMRSPVSIDRAWWELTPEQRQTVIDRIPTIGYENHEDGTGPIVSNSESVMGKDSIDWTLKHEARGNGLKALVDIWVNSGIMFNSEEDFLDVLKAAGLDMRNVSFDSPWREDPAVYPVYLKISNPLNTAAIPDEVYNALELAGKRKRAKAAAGGNADLWDKNTISGPDWLKTLQEDRAKGESLSWTRIPDWVTETLRSMGYDGVQDIGGKFHEEKHAVWIPFSDGQVKSAIGNSGKFDPNNPSIVKDSGNSYGPTQKNAPTQSAGAPPSTPKASAVPVAAGSGGRSARTKPGMFGKSGLPTWEEIKKAAKEGRTNFIREWQDNMIDLKDAQKKIEKQTGAPLPDEQNGYVKDILRYGKTEARNNAYEKNLLKPAIDQILKAKKAVGATLEDNHDYMKAKHAKERNKWIAEKGAEAILEAENDLKSVSDPLVKQIIENQIKRMKQGSGISDAEADQILAELDAEGKTAELEKVRLKYKAISDFDLDNRLSSGNISKEYKDELDSRWDYYVPMQGFEIKREDIEAMLPPIGRGADMRAKEYKKIEGRLSQAGDIMSHIALQAESGIIRAEKNIAGQAIYEMVKNNASKDWKILRDKEGKGRALVGRDEIFVVKVDGKSVYMEFKDVNLARALKKMDIVQAGAIIRAMGMLGGFIRNVATKWNPVFPPVNLIKDALQTFYFTNAEFGFMTGPQVMAAIPKSLAGMRNLQFGDGKSPMGIVAKEYVDAGGPTGYYDLGNIDGRTKELIKVYESSTVTRVMNGGKAFLNWIDGVNQVIESGTRLSVYYHLTRVKKWSTQRAAEYANKVTLPFRRKGNRSSVASQVYLFFNATVQGGARLAEVNFSKAPGVARRAWTMNAALMVGGGMILHGLMRWLMGDDEITGEPIYDKISDWEKNHNVIIPTFNTENPNDYNKIPLPYGVNFFWALGNVMSDYGAGKPGMSLMLSLAMAASDSFSPLPVAESKTGPGMVAKAAIPTATVPVASFLMNEDQFGREIWPENLPFGFKKPDSELYFKSVNPAIKAFAQRIHTATGGTKYNDNGIDWSPESIEYLLTYYTAGLGKFVNNSVATAARALDPNEEVDWSRAPFVSRFYGKVSPAIDMNRYRDAVATFEESDKELKEYINTGDAQKAQDFIAKNSPMAMLQGDYAAAKKQLKTLDDIKAIAPERENQLDSLKNIVQRTFTKKVKDAKLASDLLK